MNGWLISVAYAAEHGGHGSMPFYQDEHFWVAMGFLTIIAIFLKTAYAKVCAMLDARGIAIRERLESARRIRDEAQALLAEYQRKQRDALQESQEIIARAKNEAAKLREQAAAELEHRVAAAERQAMERIAAAEDAAKREVRHVAVDVAVAAASQVMAEKLSAKQAGALVDRAIADLPAQKFH